MNEGHNYTTICGTHPHMASAHKRRLKNKRGLKEEVHIYKKKRKVTTDTNVRQKKNHIIIQ